MGYDHARYKQISRQVVHNLLAVSAVYTDDATTQPLTVRWHNKLARNGAGQPGFDVEIIEGIDRLVFNVTELATLGLEIQRRGIVTITWPGGVVSQFQIEEREPEDGPESEYWMVSHL